MKGIRLFIMAMLLGQQAFAQVSADVSMSELRSLAIELNLPNQERMEQLMNLNDSIQLDRKKWKSRFDSLFVDTMAITPAERMLVEMDAAWLNYLDEPSIKGYSQLKANLLSLETEVAPSSGYSRELFAAMLELALGYQDYELSYRIQNRIQADNYNEWKKADDDRIAKIDSLKMTLEETDKRGQKDLEYVSGLAMMWHVIAVVAMILILLVVVILVIMFRKWKRQRKNLSARANDTSEQEALVHKLEDARREIQELKLLAKKKVDPMPVEVHVPVVPTGFALSAADISEWNDQVQQALVKIKSHCEAGKNSMAVPTYMSIINDTTRLSAQVAKKSEQWIALLNAPNERS